MIRRRVKAAVPSTFFLLLVAYFLWNATQGDLGLHAYKQRIRLLSDAQASETAAQQEQAAWLQRVSGLRDRGLNTDTLDERARATLNLADPNDIIIPYGKPTQ